jgi:hypothetical protein
MKKWFFSLAVLLAFGLKAQTVFCPAGADWHFAYGGGGLAGPVYYHNEEIKYTHDTIVLGRPAHILEHTIGYFYSECSPSVHHTYIHTSGDTVWMYNGYTLGNWQMLYNYSTPPGQSWQFNILNFVDSTSQLWNVHVNSVSQSTINSTSLKTLHVTYSTTLNMGSPTTYTYNSTIFERMGDTSYLFNFFSDFHGACDGDWAAGLLCYTDSTFGTYQQSSRPCDFSYVGIEEHSQNEDMRAYPNPAAEKLCVDAEVTSLSLTDLSGNEIVRGNHCLPIDRIPNGFYLVRIMTKKGMIVQKVVIHH